MSENSLLIKSDYDPRHSAYASYKVQVVIAIDKGWVLGYDFLVSNAFKVRCSRPSKLGPALPLELV